MKNLTIAQMMFVAGGEVEERVENTDSTASSIIKLEDGEVIANIRVLPHDKTRQVNFSVAVSENGIVNKFANLLNSHHHS